MSEELLKILQAIEKELKGNELYLKQVSRFYSLYQNERYSRLYTLIAEGYRIIELQELADKGEDG